MDIIMNLLLPTDARKEERQFYIGLHFLPLQLMLTCLAIYNAVVLDPLIVFGTEFDSPVFLICISLISLFRITYRELRNNIITKVRYLISTYGREITTAPLFAVILAIFSVINIARVGVQDPYFINLIAIIVLLPIVEWITIASVHKLKESIDQIKN